MSEKLIIKYFPENEFAKEPFYAPEGAAGLCLWGEGLYFQKQTLAMAIPKGFYGKLFPRSGLFRRHLITCDAGVIDADYRESCWSLVNESLSPWSLHT